MAAVKINVQTRQFLRELGFTIVAAVGTGAAVSAVAMMVVVMFAR